MNSDWFTDRSQKRQLTQVSANCFLKLRPKTTDCCLLEIVFPSYLANNLPNSIVFVTCNARLERVFYIANNIYTTELNKM